MRPDVVELLRCPVCAGGLSGARRALRCPSGHSFDIARQGHVEPLQREPGAAEATPRRWSRRVRRSSAQGHFRAAGATRWRRRRARRGARGAVVDIGAGTGHQLARVLDALPERSGSPSMRPARAAPGRARSPARRGGGRRRVAGASAGRRRRRADPHVFAPRNRPRWRASWRPAASSSQSRPPPATCTSSRAARPALGARRQGRPPRQPVHIAPPARGRRRANRVLDVPDA